MTETQREAIITGAAGAIGRAMTRGLPAAGMRVAVVDSDREPLETLAMEARDQAKAADLLTIQADLTNGYAAEEIARTTRDWVRPHRHPGQRCRHRPWFTSEQRISVLATEGVNPPRSVW